MFPSRTPIFEFFNTNYDYISDVQWNPVNPSMFSTVASGGAVSLWNVSKSTTEPIETINVNTDMLEDSQSTGGAISSASAASSTGSTTQQVSSRGSSNMNSTISAAGSSTQQSSFANLAGAINTSTWSRDGQSLLVGNARGLIQLISIAENSVKFSSSDESKFELLMLSQLDSHSQSSSSSSSLSSGEQGNNVSTTADATSLSLPGDGLDSA